MRRPYELWSMMLAGLVVAALFGEQASAAQTNLFATDFDTANQFKSLTWIPGYGEGTNKFLIHYDGGPTYDTDGDGLSAIINGDDGTLPWNTTYGVRVVYAPLFTTFGNFTLSGYGSGSDDYGCYCWWYLSDDGATYDYSIRTDSNHDMHYKSLSSGSAAAYNGVNVIWAKLALTGYGTMGRTAAFKLDGEIQSGLNKRVWILKNDFGTDAQLGEWTIAPNNLTNFALPASSDMDGDLLARQIANSNSWITSELVARIDAPGNNFFQYPIFQAQVGGDKLNWDTITRIYLSLDGSNWNWTASSNVTGSAQLSLNTTGITEFKRVRSIWARIKLEGNGWNASAPGPWIQDVRISAILLPPSGTIVAIR